MIFENALKNLDPMKIFFEWLSLIFSSLGVIYSIYLLYVEIAHYKTRKNKQMLFLLLFILFVLAEVINRKIDSLF